MRSAVIFVILSLIYFVLAYTSANPVDVESSDEQSSDLRGLIPNINCMIHCVQPAGKESNSKEHVDVNKPGFLQNAANFGSCLKKCSKK